MTIYTSHSLPIIEKNDFIASAVPGDNLRENINALATATNRALDTVAIDAAETALADANFVEPQDVRLARVGPASRPHAWTDPAGLTSLYTDTEGTVYAPLPIVTPGAGIATADFLAGTQDPATGKWAENVLDFDGLTPSAILAAQLLRTPGAVIVSTTEPPDPGPGQFIGWLNPTTQVLMIGIGEA